MVARRSMCGPAGSGRRRRVRPRSSGRARRRISPWRRRFRRRSSPRNPLLQPFAVGDRHHRVDVLALSSRRLWLSARPSPRPGAGCRAGRVLRFFFAANSPSAAAPRRLAVAPEQRKGLSNRSWCSRRWISVVRERGLHLRAAADRPAPRPPGRTARPPAPTGSPVRRRRRAKARKLPASSPPGRAAKPHPAGPRRALARLVHQAGRLRPFDSGDIILIFQQNASVSSTAPGPARAVEIASAPPPSRSSRRRRAA